MWYVKSWFVDKEELLHDLKTIDFQNILLFKRNILIHHNSSWALALQAKKWENCD